MDLIEEGIEKEIKGGRVQKREVVYSITLSYFTIGSGVIRRLQYGCLFGQVTLRPFSENTQIGFYIEIAPQHPFLQSYDRILYRSSKTQPPC